MATEKKAKVHYVDNKKFLAAIVERKERIREAEEIGEQKPRITNYLGECILKIANHLSYRPNFINYTYRDEMISDGIENSLQYIDNFDPEKSGTFQKHFRPRKRKYSKCSHLDVKKTLLSTQKTCKVLKLKAQDNIFH